MEEINHPNRMLERRAPKPQEQINCPRCNSTNTKFCYYNNYSLTQPRYFCKTCRRYWTEGGSLRNVPVGGGSRKNKRVPSSSSSSTSSTKLPDLNPPNNINLSDHFLQNPNPKISQKASGGHGQDLNLTFPDQSQFVHELSKSDQIDNNNQIQNNGPLPALELLRTGIASRGLNSFIPTPMAPPESNTLYTSSAGYGHPIMHDFKPNLNLFSIDHHHHHGYNGHHNIQGDHNSNGGGRINFFPFGDQLKHLSSGIDHDHNKGASQDNNNTNTNTTTTTTNNNPGGYWTGMLGGGGSW
ncbi:hypothetical protein ACFE04_018850 [Oxalis oulophora]